MSYSKDDFNEVIRLSRPIPQTEEELIVREFSDMKELLKELKNCFE